MSMMKFDPREVLRAKESSRQCRVPSCAWRWTLIGWAMLMAGNPVRDAAAVTTEDCVARCERSVALIRGTWGTGTGFVVAPGIVATSRHVIAGELVEGLQISFPTPHQHPEGPFGCTLRYVSEDHDVAFLTVEAPHPPLRLAESASLRRGQQVLTIGNPGLGDQILLNAITTGTVSSEFLIDDRRHRQISMEVNPGNSGGPILDQAGCVVGMLSCKATGKSGIAFSIPADTLREEMARAERLSVDERAELASRYRGRVLGVRYFLATAGFLKVCEIQVRGRSLDDDELLAGGLELWKQADAFSQGCHEALNAVMSDDTVPAEAKERLNELGTLHDALRDAANGPRGPMVIYVLYYKRLSDEFQRVAASFDDGNSDKLAGMTPEAGAGQ